jgi:hypothetical protein
LGPEQVSRRTKDHPAGAEIGVVAPRRAVTDASKTSPAATPAGVPIESDVEDVALAVLVATGEGAAITLDAAIRVAADTAETTAAVARARIRRARI